MIPGESVFSILNFKYLGENETKHKNILTRWSVAHAGSNYVKNGGPKSRLTVPLTNIAKFYTGSWKKYSVIYI